MNIEHHDIISRIESRKLPFSLVFLGTFTVAFIILSILGLTPDITPSQKENTGVRAGASITAEDGASLVAETPIRIEVGNISLDATISNPATTSTEALDQALLSGAVRYPTSSLLGINGTVLLFGHSSYLPVVRNQAYKTFDDIQKLKKGDGIKIFSDTKEYRFAVKSVEKANATDAQSGTIRLPQDGQHVILVTCDSFGSKEDRFIVTADLVGVYRLAE